jgi:3,5-epimerase/4-reductase
MKVLLFGSRGWIGNKFKNLLEQEEDVELFLGSSRVDNEKELELEIENIRPTHVISFIGRTHGIHKGKEYTTIDYLEQDGKLVENIRDNLYSPIVLAILSAKYNFHFSYLGTGCIWKYDEQHPFEQEENGFTEEDKPNFFESSYSTVKGFTDRLLHFFPNVLNLRIRMPVTDEFNSRNFITKITNYKKICSIKNSMSVLDELLPKIIILMREQIKGTLNFTNPGLISHNEILEMYKEIVDPSFTYENFTIEEQNLILDAGRSNNYLDTTRLESLFEIDNIKVAIRKTLMRMTTKK